MITTHVKPSNRSMVLFAEYVFESENTDAWHAIMGAIENADLTMNERGMPCPGQGEWSEGDHGDEWAGIAMMGWETLTCRMEPIPALPGIDHPLAADYFGWNVEN